MIKQIISRINSRLARRSSRHYVNWLRSKGVQIGKNTHLSKDAVIDITRPSLVTIGSGCYFNANFKLLTHDWVTHVLRNVYGEFYNSSGRVTIGNNVSTGINVTILKGVTIEDNVFIAANSLVTKNIPSNCIAGGSPARVLCTLDDYKKKRENECLEEAIDYARSIKERFNRNPVVQDFWEEFHLFIDKDNIQEYDNKLIIKQLGGGVFYLDKISQKTI